MPSTLALVVSRVVAGGFTSVCSFTEFSVKVADITSALLSLSLRGILLTVVSSVWGT